MIAVATELQIKNFWQLQSFIMHSVRSFNQAVHAKGNLLTKTFSGWMKGRTLTVWKTEEDLKAFKYSGSHKESMMEAREISKGYKTVMWECDDIPEWNEAKKKLEDVGLVKI